MYHCQQPPIDFMFVIDITIILLKKKFTAALFMIYSAVFLYYY